VTVDGQDFGEEVGGAAESMRPGRKTRRKNC
jgi:hypothetical protein